MTLQQSIDPFRTVKRASTNSQDMKAKEAQVLKVQDTKKMTQRRKVISVDICTYLNKTNVLHMVNPTNSCHEKKHFPIFSN